MTTLEQKESCLALWQEVIKTAEDRCSISLKEELESYLVSLLIRHLDKPEITKQIFATAYLKALQLEAHQRTLSLQQVGDHCLLFAGLFPLAAEKKQVKISYFVNLGRSAYSTISHTTNDLFSSLSFQFVLLMDVLQSIRPFSDLLPLQAYEQWNEVGSQRALRILQEYSQGCPLKIIK